MEQEFLNLILVGSVILLTIVDIATFFIVLKLFTMHNKKNRDGQYSFMVPEGWCELQEKLNSSQERIVGAIAELSVHNSQSAKLLETLTNAVLEMRQELNKK